MTDRLDTPTPFHDLGSQSRGRRLRPPLESSPSPLRTPMPSRASAHWTTPTTISSIERSFRLAVTPRCTPNNKQTRKMKEQISSLEERNAELEQSLRETAESLQKTQRATAQWNLLTQSSEKNTTLKKFLEEEADSRTKKSQKLMKQSQICQKRPRSSTRWQKT